MKAISIRIDDRLGRQFEEVCQETGYKKNTLLTRLIASFVRHHHATTGSAKKRDPFAGVIGLMQAGPLLNSPDAIDKAVYDL